MGSFKLILLIPFFTFGQSFKEFSTKHNDAVHFYAAFMTNEAAYQIQSYAFPKWKPARKILVSNAITVMAIVLKEVYDKHKPNPTGVSKLDMMNGGWSIPVYDIFNIVRRDFLGHDVNKLVY
jgi:hypothetical protein